MNGPTLHPTNKKWSQLRSLGRQACYEWSSYPTNESIKKPTLNAHAHTTLTYNNQVTMSMSTEWSNDVNVARILIQGWHWGSNNVDLCDDIYQAMILTLGCSLSIFWDCSPMYKVYLSMMYYVWTLYSTVANCGCQLQKRLKGDREDKNKSRSDFNIIVAFLSYISSSNRQ